MLKNNRSLPCIINKSLLPLYCEKTNTIAW
nr:MAG TPA_asm: hypothetical protein [Caudoviricetes sp.]